MGVERVMGIEPTRSAWEAEILPLNYTRICCALGIITTAIWSVKAKGEMQKRAKMPEMPESPAILRTAGASGRQKQWPGDSVSSSTGFNGWTTISPR